MIATDEQRKKEAESYKIRVNKKGAGRSKNLSADTEIYLTLFYLRHMPIFEVLGMMFEVSKTTANDIFHCFTGDQAYLGAERTKTPKKNRQNEN